MRPSSTFDDTHNMRIGDIESLCDLNGGQPLRVERSNLKHVGFFELGIRSLSTPSIKSALSSFAMHILNIFGARSRPEVSGVDAAPVGDVSWWVVCVARVADIAVVWDRPIVQDVRDAMGVHLFSFSVSELTIAGRGKRRCPHPAFIWVADGNFGPEPICQRQDRSLWVVSWKKSKWSPFYHALSGVGLLGDVCGLTTAAFAEFYRRFVRGMIVHVVSPFLTTGHSVGLFAQSPRSFIA